MEIRRSPSLRWNSQLTVGAMWAAFAFLMLPFQRDEPGEHLPAGAHPFPAFVGALLFGCAVFRMGVTRIDRRHVWAWVGTAAVVGTIVGKLLAAAAFDIDWSSSGRAIAVFQTLVPHAMLFGVAAIAAVEGIMEQRQGANGVGDRIDQAEETQSNRASGFSTDHPSAGRSTDQTPTAVENCGPQKPGKYD